MAALRDVLEFVENPEPRCPCVLAIDTSLSMVRNDTLSLLNKEIRELKESLEKDYLASLRVELSVVAFSDDARVLRDFATVDNFDPPDFQVDGFNSRIERGIRTALNHIESRKLRYSTSGVPCHRSWALVFTDCETQDYQDTFNNLRAYLEKADYFRIVKVPISTADIPKRGFDTLKSPDIRELFDNLAISLSEVSKSKSEAEKLLDKYLETS